MGIALGFCILAGVLASPSESQYVDPITIYATDFGEAADKDFNGWPDGWVRRRGPGYPHYVKVRLDFEATDDTRGTLRIDLNGGAVEITSPPIQVDALHLYALQGRAKTDGLIHDRVFLTFTLLDGRKRVLRTLTSTVVGGTNPWTELVIPPSNVIDEEPRYLTIGLHVDQAAQGDLRGAVWFSGLRLIQVPRLRVEPNNRLQLYTDPGSPEVTVRASGLRHRATEVTLEIRNHDDQLLATETLPIEPKSNGDPNEYAATIRWKPRLTDNGYFRVLAKIAAADGGWLEGQTALLIMDPGRHVRGRFGWSLRSGMDAVKAADLVGLAGEAGVGWMKVPLWKEEISSETSALVDQLNERGISCVGVLDDPPPSVREKLGDPARATAADIFNSPGEIWHASAQSVLQRFGLDVRYWQLGADGDRSFVGYPDVVERLTAIKEQLETSGPALHLGVNWDWIEEVPPAEATCLRFVSMSATPPVTDEELLAYLSGVESPQPARWVQIEPQVLSGVEKGDRAGALVRRMVEACAGGASGIFFGDPLHPDVGLLTSDGRPTPMYLTWRTTALALDGTTHLGTMTLPGGSANRVFVQGDRAVMVVWSDHPTEEILYLGERVEVHDMYGARQKLEHRDERVVLRTGVHPVLVSGLKAAVARWRNALRVAHDKLPSVPGGTFDQSVSVTNTFEQTVSGRGKLIAPPGWIVAPPNFDFRLGAGEALEQPLRITLPYGVETGTQPARFEFEVFADRTYRFEVFQPLQVGLGDVAIHIDTQLDENGALEIEQQLVNTTDQSLRFICSLFSRNRRRQQFELTGPADGRTYATVRLPNGRDLIGETIWLRATEVGGPRVLNYRFVAEP